MITKIKFVSIQLILFQNDIYQFHYFRTTEMHAHFECMLQYNTYLEYVLWTCMVVPERDTLCELLLIDMSFPVQICDNIDLLLDIILFTNSKQELWSYL